MALNIGEAAPEIKLKSTSGKIFNLHADLKDKACILFFYPKDFTPGCTKEACSFRDHFAYFSKLDLQVIGISTDSMATHLKFQAEHQLPFELLSDASGEVSKKYKALVPFINISKRVTYLLDTKHIIRGVYQELFGYESHIEAMVKAIKAESTS